MSGEVVAVVRRRVEADELALVLLSQGVHALTFQQRDGFRVEVRPEDAEYAATLLERYHAENRPEPEPPKRPSVRLPADTIAGLALALLVMHLVTGGVEGASEWFEVGRGSSVRILRGEWWRAVTALTLHADWGHVLGNVLFGALFFGAVGRAFGGGVGGALVLAGGVLGNFANAWVHQRAHLWVGASTAVFAAVGVLAGLGIARYGRSVLRGRRAFVPVAAGLGLVAMLGTSPDSDIWAHVLGFASGVLLGWPAARLLARAPGRLVQVLCGALALATLAASWWRAWS